MHAKDPEHWLYRLEPSEWLRAAENELTLSRQAFLSRKQRPAATYARRAAGMALNALLHVALDPAYGRSYMDHIKALSADPGAPQEVRAAAQRLLEMPMTQEVVVLGKGAAAQADPAETILNYVRGLIAPSGKA